MLFTDSGSGRATALAKEVDGTAVTYNEDLVKQSDFVVLAVKPAELKQVASSLSAPRAVLSLLGATPLARLAEEFPESTVLRLMPNLGVEVNRGVICVAHSEELDSRIITDAKKLLGSISTVFELPDGQMDIATAVMGCPPAYFAVAAEALTVSAVADGLDPEIASALVAGALDGTAGLLGARSPFEIQVAVASPGGSTEAGLEALAEAEGAEAFRAAYRASVERMRGG